MDYIEVLGYVAISLSTMRYIPQIFKLINTRSAEDLSWGMINFTLLSQVLTIAYSYIKYLYPVFITQLLSFFLSIVISIQKIYYDKKNDDTDSKDTDSEDTLFLYTNPY